MESVFLVCWIEDDPIKFSVQSRTDISDGNLRSLPAQSLIGKTVPMSWNRRIFNAKILGYGTRGEMKDKLVTEIKNAESLPCEKNKKRDAAPSKNSKDQQTKKRVKIDSVLQLAMSPLTIPESDTENIIAELRQELSREKEAHEECKEALRGANLCIESMKDDTVSIGNNVFVKKSSLSALKSLSGNVNTYARNVFRHVFEIHKVVGRSLTGKKCNANKTSEINPSIEAAKRDAVIEHALSTYSIIPGSALYHLTLKDVKHTLRNLIREMNLEAKKAEESTLEMLAENNQF